MLRCSRKPLNRRRLLRPENSPALNLMLLCGWGRCLFTRTTWHNRPPMGELQKQKPGSTAIAPKADGNPQGKGLSGFLLDWHQSAPRGVVAKPQRQVLAEFFTSMLVLSAAFKYKPAVGVSNYLYFINGEWSLSLIGPEEWTEERQAGFAGECILQRDMTWTIEPSELLTEKNAVSDAVGRFYDAFAESLNTDLTLEEILPFYVDRMPYYQRLYAGALSRSVRATVLLGDQAARRSRDWLLMLPNLEGTLLPSHVNETAASKKQTAAPADPTDRT